MGQCGKDFCPVLISLFPVNSRFDLFSDKASVIYVYGDERNSVLLSLADDCCLVSCFISVGNRVVRVSMSEVWLWWHVLLFSLQIVGLPLV